MTDPKSRIKVTSPTEKHQLTPDEEPRLGPIRRRSSIAYHFVKDLIKPKQEDPVAPRPRRRSSAALQRLRDLVIPSKENSADDRLRLRRSSTDELKGLRDRLTPTRETFALGRKSKEERRRFEHVKPGVLVQKFDQDVGTTKLDPPLELQTLVVTLPGALTLDGVAAEPAKPQDAKQEASSKPKKAYKSKFTEVFEGDAGYVPRPITPPFIQTPLSLTAEPVSAAAAEPLPAALAELAPATPAEPTTAPSAESVAAIPARVVHRVPFLDDPSEPESRIDQSFFGVGEWPPHLIEDWTTGSKILIPHPRRAEEHRVDKRDPPEINPKAEKGVTMRLGVTGEDDPRRWKVWETYVDEPVAYTAGVVAEPKGRAKWGDDQEVMLHKYMVQE
ncbi:hypothetical protein B0A48_17080 [Cryoendolithus antarcticus]|uniref:Uncharacterized protein n=1 Tax=Cryoendolithus antarcticus TaxID=1507870 RepID=A0A1V8SBW6_9PEZI|nr:hypothetical protein B0A48_17080 [Cryoendolithus antarcticus]